MNESRPLPIGLKVVIAFLFVEGIKYGAALVPAIGGGSTPTGTIAWLGVLSVANFAMALVLCSRSRIGPVWAIFLLATELIWNLTFLTIETPDHWIQVGMMGRLGILTTLAVELSLISYLIFLQFRPQPH